jgi:hypothetical protein
MPHDADSHDGFQYERRSGESSGLVHESRHYQRWGIAEKHHTDEILRSVPQLAENGQQNQRRNPKSS